MIAIYFIPGVIYQKFLLPKIHGWANHDEPKMLEIYQAGNGIMLLLGFVILASLFFLAPQIIPIIFGSEYGETSEVLRILLFCIPIRFLATSVEAPLFTKELMKWNGKAIIHLETWLRMEIIAILSLLMMIMNHQFHQHH